MWILLNLKGLSVDIIKIKGTEFTLNYHSCYYLLKGLKGTVLSRKCQSNNSGSRKIM